MSEGVAGSTETFVRPAERIPSTKKATKIRFVDDVVEGDPQTETQPPLQQVLRGPEPSLKKPKSSRRSSKRSSVQSPRLTANHIEAAAGDVSDLSASLILACLFCHFSDCVLLLPGMCSSGLRCLCPYTCLPDFYDLCCCSPSCCNHIDWGFLDVCQHTAECLELAMEISELCYH